MRPSKTGWLIFSPPALQVTSAPNKKHMNTLEFGSSERRFLLALAIFGAVVPNGIFVYYFLASPETTKAALTNPISLVFITEAFILMFLFAWLLRKAACRKPSGALFVVMSLLGTMVFSIPAALWMQIRRAKE